jgi:hypothetical protein
MYEYRVAFESSLEVRRRCLPVGIVEIYLNSERRPRSFCLPWLDMTEQTKCSTSSSFSVGPVGFPTVGTAAYRLIVPPCFRVSLVSARRAARTDVARDLWQGKGELWARNGRLNLVCNWDFHGNCKDFLHAAKLRHGTDDFTSPPKEGAVRNFSPEKFDFGRVWTHDHRSRLNVNGKI